MENKANNQSKRIINKYTVDGKGNIYENGKIVIPIDYDKPVNPLVDTTTTVSPVNQQKPLIEELIKPIKDLNEPL